MASFQLIHLGWFIQSIVESHNILFRVFCAGEQHLLDDLGIPKYQQ